MKSCSQNTELFATKIHPIIFIYICVVVYCARLILRCRQLARAKFAAMRNDALVKMELLDQKHGIVTSKCVCVLAKPHFPLLRLLCRVVLRCRQTARAKFAQMRSDSLVKLELLDNKHGIIQQLLRCTGINQYIFGN